MKKIISLILSGMLLLSFAGCQSGENSTAESSPSSAVQGSSEAENESSEESAEESSREKDIFNFADYESSDIFNIEKIELSSELSAMCDTYEFYYNSDGYQIKAYVSIPSECISTRKPSKCLLYYRGGHYNYGALNYDMLSTICGAVGRIVVACEIRGDNGSGGCDQFGGDEMHDVFRLIDLCENNFKFADMDDFCVAGISRGGMSAYMTARQDKRVKKLVIGSGVSDAAQIYKDRPDMQKLLCECIGGTPDELPEEYEKRSAVCWADEIKIPVLIIHSKDDVITLFEAQAQRIYDMLKDSTDCTLITHDDDYHGIQKEDIPKIKEWLNKT